MKKKWRRDLESAYQNQLKNLVLPYVTRTPLYVTFTVLLQTNKVRNMCLFDAELCALVLAPDRHLQTAINCDRDTL
jgi:hypothetical protein